MNKKISEIIITGAFVIACCIAGIISFLICIRIAWYFDPSLSGNSSTYLKISSIGLIGTFISGIATYFKPRLMFVWIFCFIWVFLFFGIISHTFHWIIAGIILFCFCLGGGKIALWTRARVKKI